MKNSWYKRKMIGFSRIFQSFSISCPLHPLFSQNFYDFIFPFHLKRYEILKKNTKLERRFNRWWDSPQMKRRERRLMLRFSRSLIQHYLEDIKTQRKLLRIHFPVLFYLLSITSFIFSKLLWFYLSIPFKEIWDIKEK